MNDLDVSVVVPTFNRAAGLPVLLDRLLDQESGEVRYEVLMVDNHSTDQTRSIVQRAIASDTTGRLRYAFEPRQGVSYARNTGVELTFAPVILFLDDDCVPALDWVRSMKEAFDQHAEADCIGGRVRGIWRQPPPTWMQRAHTAPIATQDWPMIVHVSARSAWHCLITANLGFRRHVFERVGGFSPDYPRNQDRELQLRMWRAHMQGLYLPGMEVTVEVPPERLERRYHRRWRATTGKYQALMLFRESVGADESLRELPYRGRTILGVPLFIYRECLAHLVGWVRAMVRGRSDERFLHETRIWYCGGFLLARWRDPRARRTFQIPMLTQRTAPLAQPRDARGPDHYEQQ
jgi:glycosyltransferase involved in cell wall biosynthesis